ncbi:MAG: L,D-transpeptidase [Acidipila sp.]|nr:L,D-transpeptidase [Acidipila sp.]
MSQIAVNRNVVSQIAVSRIVVSIVDRKLALIAGDGAVTKIYDVAVGAAETPSPEGKFIIASRVENPSWYWPGKIVPAGPQNPLGPRWMGLGFEGFGIHGTNQPHSIGQAASHGCIRMRNRDVEELFVRVRVGDVVEMHSEHDAAVALIFGSSPERDANSPASLLSAAGSRALDGSLVIAAAAGAVRE